MLMPCRGFKGMETILSVWTSQYQVQMTTQKHTHTHIFGIEAWYILNCKSINRFSVSVLYLTNLIH